MRHTAIHSSQLALGGRMVPFAGFEMPVRYGALTTEHMRVREAVGLTDYAQDQLGEVVFVELPEVGAAVEAGDAFGVVESTKSVSDLFAEFMRDLS